MKTKKNWPKIAVFIVLALTSLSSVATTVAIKGTASAEPALNAAPVCTTENSITRFEQYLDVVEWEEQGGTGPAPALPGICQGDDLKSTAERAGYGAQSWARVEQYVTDIVGTASVEPAPNAAPVCTTENSIARFEQYLAVVEWEEQGGTGPAPDLPGICQGDDLKSIAERAGYGAQSWARVEQYMADTVGIVP